MNETWKWISGYKGLYDVSDLGRVRRHYKNGSIRDLSQYEMMGFHKVCLSKNSKRAWLMVHRLVAEAFVQNTERKECVIHLDRNKLNNNAENLVWMTHKERVNHANSGKNERIELDIHALRKLYAEEGRPQREIAKILGVSTMTIITRLKKYGIIKNQTGACNQ